MQQNNIICRRFFVTGKVQGVFYRANTQQQAQRLHLTGWVRNLADGRVEVLACGKMAHVDQLHDWLWQGPPAADVTDVVIASTPYETFANFAVKS